jgi:pimeloyl-ACP methyl ester carboxylesterase
MKRAPLVLLFGPLIFAVATVGQNAPTSPQCSSTARQVELKTLDGVILKASYFAAAKPGPAVLLFHQSNRTRQSWDDVAKQLAIAGINVLTVDNRGHGESAGKEQPMKAWWPADLDVAFNYLAAQPGVTRDVVGIGGAGVLGVENSVETARRHPMQVKSLALLSGETNRPGSQFLYHASQLPGLYIVSDEDEYPPIEEAMELLYATASSPAKKLIHFAQAEQAPWRWYEPVDIGKVPANGGHGTDLFKRHPELPGIIVRWFVTTLVKTPGHAPADAVAAGPLLAEVEFGNGITHARRLLEEARKQDPKAQLWPEVSMTKIAEDLMRAGDAKTAIEVLKLNLQAYPDSADVDDNLGDAYLQNGQGELARHYAKTALAILDAHKGPASSWTDTDEYRGEIRRSAEKKLKTVSEKSAD